MDSAYRATIIRSRIRQEIKNEEIVSTSHRRSSSGLGGKYLQEEPQKVLHDPDEEGSRCTLIVYGL